MKINKKSEESGPPAKAPVDRARPDPNPEEGAPDSLEGSLPGIHVIGEKDFERHFGTPEGDKGDESRVGALSGAPSSKSGTPGEVRPSRPEIGGKVAVSLRVDRRIWLRAAELAGQRALTVDEYAELAIGRLNDSISKQG